MTENETVDRDDETAMGAAAVITAMSEQDARARSLAVTPIEGAPEGLIRYGQRYWTMRGVDEFGTVVWAESTSAIEPRSGQPYLSAGAGVEATVADVACTRCGVTPWRAKSRNDFAVYVSIGRSALSGCGRCNTNYLTGVARQTDPATLARRVANQEAEARRAEETRHLGSGRNGSAPSNGPGTRPAARGSRTITH